VPHVTVTHRTSGARRRQPQSHTASPSHARCTTSPAHTAPAEPPFMTQRREGEGGRGQRWSCARPCASLMTALIPTHTHPTLGGWGEGGSALHFPQRPELPTRIRSSTARNSLKRVNSLASRGSARCGVTERPQPSTPAAHVWWWAACTGVCPECGAAQHPVMSRGSQVVGRHG